MVAVLFALNHLVQLSQNTAHHAVAPILGLLAQVVSDLGDFAQILSFLLIGPAHHNKGQLVFLGHHLPPLLHELVSLTTLHLRVIQLDLGNLFSPIESVSSQESQLSGRLHGFIFATILQLVNLGS